MVLAHPRRRPSATAAAMKMMPSRRVSLAMLTLLISVCLKLVRHSYAIADRILAAPTRYEVRRARMRTQSKLANINVIGRLDLDPGLK